MRSDTISNPSHTYGDYQTNVFRHLVHSLAPALTLTLTLNNLANKPHWKTSTLFGLMYPTTAPQTINIIPNGQISGCDTGTTCSLFTSVLQWVNVLTPVELFPITRQIVPCAINFVDTHGTRGICLTTLRSCN